MSHTRHMVARVSKFPQAVPWQSQYALWHAHTYRQTEGRRLQQTRKKSAPVWRSDSLQGKPCSAYRDCLDCLIPPSPLWLSGENNRVPHQHSSPHPVILNYLSRMEWNWKCRFSISLWRRLYGHREARIYTHRKHTGTSPKTLSTRTSGSRRLPNKLLFLQNPGNIGLPGAR